MIGTLNFQLGCGTALPGLVACKLGGRVTLSDKHTPITGLQNCQEICQLNDVQANVIGLNWGVLDGGIQELPKFDVILGSDCFYNKDG